MASYLGSKKSATSSLSTFLGTHNAALKWKSSLFSSDYFSRKINKDPGTFDIKLNDNPVTRKLVERSEKMCFPTDEDCNKDELSIVELQSNHALAPSKRFNVALAREIMTTALRELLDDEKSSGLPNGNLCKLVADEIKQRLKTSGFLRYKIISIVSLVHGGKKQDVLIASRCLWNTNFDNFIQEIFQNKHLCAIATVYVMYCD